MEHHELSMSKWPMWANCPHFDSSGPTAETEAGTRMHEDFAEAINEINTGEPALHSSPGAYWAASVIHEIVLDEKIHSEQKVEVIDTGCPELNGIFGYCDAWAVKDGHLYVFDYKSGAKGDLDYMPQLMGYAFALLSSALGPFVVDDDVDLVVLYGADHSVVRRKAYADEVAEVAKRIVRSRLAKGESEPKVNPACRYCAHRMECKAVSRDIVAFQRNELTDMSDAKLYFTLTAMKSVIEAELERLKRVALDSESKCLQDGDLKYEVRTDKRGRAQLTDITSLYNEACERGMEVPFETVLGNVLIGKEAFKELFKAEAKKNGVKVKELDEMYAKYTKFGTPATKLVRVEVA